MACKLIYNEQGERIGVLEKNSDNPSYLFQSILNNPLIPNFDSALEAYQNIYSLREEKPIGYNSDTEQLARERFNISDLEQIGKGSDRTVFRLEDGKVLKVAHSARGLAQNYWEGDWMLEGITPKIYERGLNYVVVQDTPRIKSTDVVNTYNVEGEETGTTMAGQMLKDLARFTQSDFDKRDSDLQDTLYKYGFQDILSYEVLFGDFKDKRNWGYLDGQPVHLDGGTFGGVKMLEQYRGKTNLEDEDFKAIYNESKKLKKEFGDNDKYTMFSLSTAETILKYKTNNDQFFNSYSEALRATTEENIQLGINTVNGFETLATISPNTNIQTQPGLINHLIKAEVLSDQSYKENGRTHLKPEGKTYTKQRINGEIIKDAFQKQLGIKSATLNADNTVSLNEDQQREKIIVTANDGSQITVNISDLDKPFSQLKKQFDSYTIAQSYAAEAFSAELNKNKADLKNEFIPETELQQKLINLLKKFGIKTLSFEDYLKNYSKRNNLPISAKALADMANKLIAFKDGIIENDELVEEVSHLIEASTPLEQKENILRNIHKTKEWMEFAKQYEGVYATEEELRREILGKAIANSIKEQFAARENNQTENSIIAKIKEFFDQFIARIQSFFQESYKIELENLEKEIYRNLFAENLNLDLEGVNNIFFNANEASVKSNELVSKTKQALEAVKQQERLLARKYQNPANKAFINSSERLLETKDALDQLNGVAQFTRLISSQVNQLVEAANKKEEGQYPLSAEENVVYQNLQKRVRPLLSSIKSMLDSNENIQTGIISELEKINGTLQELEAKVAKQTAPAIRRMALEIADRHGMTSKEREEYMAIIEASLKGNIKDTDYMHAVLGSMLQARNPLLNLAGLIIKRMGIQSTSDFQKSFKDMTNKLISLNWTNKDWDKIIDKGSFTIINPISKQKAAELDKKEKNEIISNLLKQDLFEGLRGLKIDDTTDFENLLSENEPLKDEIEFFAENFTREWNEKVAARKETFFSSDYLERLKNHKILIDGKEPYITNDAQVREKEYRRESTQIRINAGEKLTKSDKAKLKEISQRRAEDANPRSIATGEFLKGIKEVYDNNLEKYVVVLDDNFVKLSTEEQLKAEVVVGLNHISYKNQDFFRQENEGKTNEIPQKFLEELRALPQEEQLEFLENNAYISFPDEFYNQFKMNSGLVTRLREAGEETLVEDIRRQQAIINRILRVNSVDGRPSETNYVEMTKVQKDEVKLAQMELETLYANARLVLEAEEVDSELNVDNIPNQAYFNYLADTGVNELEFIMENTTTNERSSIETAKRIVQGKAPITKGFKTWFNENMTDVEREDALIQYARTKLLPYLKRTEPVGYSEEFNKVLSGETSVEQWINRTDLVKVSPSFSFYETSNTNLNPKWQENKNQGKEQWTEEYINKVKDERYDSIQNTPKLKAGYDALMEYYDYQIQNNNLTGVQSRYQIPGVRRTATQRTLSLDAASIKETFNEMLEFRPEEKELGNSLNTIPTYYNTPLPDSKEQTTDYLYAFALYGQSATTHKYRRENISDMYLLQDALSDVADQGKNTMKMFNSFMDYNFFGKKDTFSYKILGGRVDVGKVLKVLNNFAKTTNLAGVIIPITSATTATVQKNIERLVGEVIDPTSSNIGNKYFVKYASSSARESMGFESKSIPNVIGESLGLYSITHRYENSQIGKAGRTLINLNSKLHEMGNFPVIQRAMFGMIASYRYVDGKIMHFTRFKQKLQAEGFKGNIQSEWKKQPEFIDDFISAVKDGVLDFSNPEFLNKMQEKVNNGQLKLPEGRTLQEYLEERKLDISARTLSFVNRVDSQISQDERSVVQRDARASFLLSHLGWLTSTIQRKFKYRHFNLSEESMPQEGSWRTAANFVGNIAKNPKNFKEIYNSLDGGQKKNLRRTLIEVGYTQALVLLALILSDLGDDDDAMFATVFLDYFVNRTAVETISATTGLPDSVYSVIDQPLMLKRKMEDWAKITDLGGESEERMKYLKNILPFARDISKFSDLRRATETYLYFNETQKGVYSKYGFISKYLADIGQ